MDDEDLDIVSEQELDEFDVGTSILIMTDGTARLQFGLMPPSWPHADGAFERIDEELQQALGVEVEAHDKELFSLATSDPDKLRQLREWLLARRRQLELV